MNTGVHCTDSSDTVQVTTVASSAVGQILLYCVYLLTALPPPCNRRLPGPVPVHNLILVWSV
jgi:hypothetical protein